MAAKGVRIEEIRESIVRTLAAGSFSTAVAWHAYRPFWSMSEMGEYPCGIVGHDAPVGWMLTFGPHGLAELKFKVDLFTTSTDCISAEKALDGLLSAGTTATMSVFDALRVDPTFGGACGTSIAMTATPPRPMEEPNGFRYWKSTIPLSCTVSRS